jgi:hypothetical protein
MVQELETVVDNICDVAVGDIWFELSDVADAVDDQVHRGIVNAVREAVRKGIELGKRL